MEKMKSKSGLALAMLLAGVNGILYGQVLKLATVALLLAGSLTSCEQKAENNSASSLIETNQDAENNNVPSLIESNQDEENNIVSPLTGTKWKLETLIDANGTAREPEPEPECIRDDCYTIIFEPDTTFAGTSASNELLGTFDADFARSTISVKTFVGTKLSEVGDGQYYCDKIRTIRAYSLMGNELTLYFDNQNDYLKFKPLEQTVKDAPLIGVKWKLEILVDKNGTARKPKCHNDSYTIIFNSDTIFWGRTTRNEIFGTFYADFDQSRFSVKAFDGTRVEERGDGKYYWNKWYKIRTFSLTENELILYCEHENDYLKFKPLEK